jgi:hypothetical protein
MDVTEIFNRVDKERKTRGMKLAFVGLVGIVTGYNILHALLATVLTKAGRETAAKILRDAAHSPMYHMF